MTNIYVSKALRKDIPSEAILLSSKDVLKIHWETIENWKPRIDVWPFTYGISALASLNVGSSINIVHHYRRRLNIQNFGRVTMYLPTSVLPSILSTVFHFQIVTNSILLQDECPVCIQVRAGFLQMASGVLYPLVASPFAGFFYATRYGTYDVPPVRREYLREIFMLWFNMTRKLGMKIPIALAANGLAASVLTYFEANTFFNVQRKVLEKEQEFKRNIYGDKEVV